MIAIHLVSYLSRQQILMFTPFDDLTLIQHQYQVGVTDRAEAMSDDKARPPFEKLFERLLDQAIDVYVYT